MKMQWNKLLSSKRLGSSECLGDGIRTEYYRDYDRIVFSASFRRLARKTQVHPLSFNDHIHNRLTHSIEVSSVGRSLGLAVGLAIKDKLPTDITAVDFASIIQAACVAHDIGNPPFGHAGEYAIRQWFTENENLLNSTLTIAEQNDLKYFEGNAQGLRIVTQLEGHYKDGGLRLTYATLGALIKYPWKSDNKLASEKEKFNVFQSEVDIYSKISEELGLIKLDDERYSRHPLAYLMEAADDICYKILDIEDALELDLLRIEDVIPIFKKLSNAAEFNEINDIGSEFSSRKRIVAYRAKVIDNLIREVVAIFEHNYNDIMEGKFEGDLISKVTGDCQVGIQEIKEMTTDKIFSYRRKIELEVGSYSSIESILSAFITAINQKIDNIATFKSKRILDLMQDDLPSGESTTPYEYYMAITDFVSGMTDNYATFIAKQINGNAK
ncbi:deoxyguanosinetriphosphate triphosphohydrolase [Shewanella pealeana]|uniref:Putative deoxyguanosinetriphosphate triphosphohydrolase n=1 Tax=Shewanella pealeana (strain ATCC 700345 / ANG-SQ1) TaxID=398579 RepID=A8H6P7_SHEPA|nr:deoxyguanosinetriphosphate triphosphohydrolase [Shewanella pealeana]ABV88234.1 putative deoxyguanosinetriphosphate triphosphohydrolase [Shewanella pealeana ATCC 700345]